MIAIGQKPRLYFNDGHNDMSHWMHSSWEAPEPTLVTDEMYMKFLTFTDPTLMQPQPQGLIGGILEMIGHKDGKLGETLDDMMGTSTAKRLQRAIQLNPQKSLLWQFDGLSTDLKSFRRGAICLGERNFQVWGWLDLHVKLPVLRLLAKMLNKTLYFQHKKEKKNWDKVLSEVRKK